MSKLAVDVSNHTGILSREILDDLNRWKIGHLMAGTQVPSVTNAQIHQAYNVGWGYDVYAYLDPAATLLRDDMNNAKYAVEDFPSFFETGNASRLWLDCEWVRNGMTNSQVIMYIYDAKKAALKAGFKRIGIYTRASWWEDMVSSEVLFTTLPLWYSRPGSESLRPSDWREQGFGGWWKPAWRQYALDEEVRGVKLDFSVSPS